MSDQMTVIIPQNVVDDGYNTTDAELLASTVSASSESTWDNGSPPATYSTDDVVKYQLTSGEDEGIWHTYVSLQNANTSKNPVTETSWWTDQGATNRFKMFDMFTNTVTSDDTNDITVTLLCHKINTIAFLSVQASEIQIKLYKGTALGDKTAANTVLDTHTNPLIINLAQSCADWYGYFFDDYTYTKNIVTQVDLPPYANLLVEITFVKLDGYDCECGHCIPGKAFPIGRPRYGIKAGMIDYSKIEEDSIFGYTYLSQGNYKKTMEVDLILKSSEVNRVYDVVTGLRAIPCVWQANPDNREYEPILVYGFFDDFDLVISDPNWAEVALSIRGMI